ncbi:MAG: ABC transporter permease [Clostridiales bacterium]|nr:ABC transporter permease [Clostridiales bacterium]
MKNRFFPWIVSFTGYLLLLLLFFTMKNVLAFMNIEYRLWLLILGYLGSILGIIALAGWFLWILFQKGIQKSQEKGNSVRALTITQHVILAVYGLLSLLILVMVGIFSLFHVHQEKSTPDGQLMVDFGNYLSDSYWYDYEKVSFWGRKPAYGVEELEMLKAKYQRDFTMDTTGMEVGKLRYIPVDYPDISVTVYDVKEKKDNFLQGYLDSILFQAYSMSALTQTVQVTYEASEMGNFTLLLDEDETDFLSYSKDVARLVEAAIRLMEEDSKLPVLEGSLYIKAEAGAFSEELLEIPFGVTLTLKNGQEGIYYTDYEMVYDKIMEYMGIDESQTALSEDESTGESVPLEEDASTVPVVEDELETLAYAIYEKALIQQEDYFEFTYNAKGNPYAILGSGEGVLDGQEILIRRTLVYDRSSKNGKCEIFVYYEEHYDKNGNQQDNTTILNMYAVDKTTKTVYTADRFAWADVGNETYREAVGE